MGCLDIERSFILQWSLTLTSLSGFYSYIVWINTAHFHFPFFLSACSWSSFSLPLRQNLGLAKLASLSLCHGINKSKYWVEDHNRPFFYFCLTWLLLLAHSWLIISLLFSLFSHFMHLALYMHVSVWIYKCCIAFLVFISWCSLFSFAWVPVTVHVSSLCVSINFSHIFWSASLCC